MGAQESKPAATVGAQSVAAQESQIQKIIEEVKTVDDEKEEQFQKTKEEEVPIAIEEAPPAIEEKQSQKVNEDPEPTVTVEEQTPTTEEEFALVAIEEEQAQKTPEPEDPVAIEERQLRTTNEQEALVVIEEVYVHQPNEEAVNESAELIAIEEEQSPQTNDDAAPVAIEEEQTQQTHEQEAPLAIEEEQEQEADEEVVPVATGETQTPTIQKYAMSTAVDWDPSMLPNEIERLRSKYEEQAHSDQPSPRLQFEYACLLVCSPSHADVREGTELFDELLEADYQRTAVLHHLTLAHLKLGQDVRAKETEPVAEEEEQPANANDDVAPVEVPAPDVKEDELSNETSEGIASDTTEEEQVQNTSSEVPAPDVKEDELPKEASERVASDTTEEEPVRNTSSEARMWRLGSTREVDMLLASLKKLRVVKLREGAKVPKRGSVHAAGYDLFASEPVTIPAGGRGLVMTGLTIAIPEGTYARIAPRSGLTVNHGINVGAGVIDFDYRDEVGVVLFNHDSEDFEVKQGDPVAQIILEKITTPEVEIFDAVDELGITERDMVASLNAMRGATIDVE